MNYFAYGSNISKKQMATRCPGSKPKISAILPNYKLIFTGWSRRWKGGTASIKHYNGQKVYGVVYEVSEADLKKLDNHEGYPGTYDRMNVIVFTDTDDPMEAFTYIKKDQSQETEPSVEYTAIIRQGYKDWQIE